MKSGTIIAVLVLAGYIGFEAYAINKVRHRTEPAYIYQLLIEARAAATLCNHPALELQPRFDRTLTRVSASYLEDLAGEQNNPPQSELDMRLEQQIIAANLSIEKAVADKGCEDPELKAHFQRYRIYARKTR